MSPDLTVISESAEAEEDRRFWKVLLIALLGAACLLASFFLFDKFLVEGNFRRLWGGLLFAVLFFALFILQVFFIKSRAKMMFLAFIQAAAPIFVFNSNLYPSPSLALIVGFVLFFIFLTAGAIKGQGELLNSLKVRFFWVAKNILRRAVSGFLIVLSLIFYLTYFVWGSFNENFAEKLVNQTLTASEPIIKVILTEVSFQSTVDEFLRTIAENELKKIKIRAADAKEKEPLVFQRLTPPEKEQLITTFSAELKKQIEQIVGPLDGNATVNAEVLRIIKDYVDSLSAPAKSVGGVIITVLFFFAGRGIAFLFSWLPEFISFVLFKLLLITGFAYISLESRSREFIMLS